MVVFDKTSVFLLEWLRMAKSLSLTIVDDNNLRGVIAPSSVVSKKMLADLIDFIELSAAVEIDMTEKSLKEADRNNSWISFQEASKQAKRAK